MVLNLKFLASPRSKDTVPVQRNGWMREGCAQTNAWISVAFHLTTNPHQIWRQYSIAPLQQSLMLLLVSSAVFVHETMSPMHWSTCVSWVAYAPGTIAVNVTWIEREFNALLSNASQHLQPFLRYSKLLVENCDIFTPHLCLAVPQGLTQSEFREDLDIYKTRMNGLSCGEESMTICSAVLIQYQRVTDGQTDRQTDVQPISITCIARIT